MPGRGVDTWLLTTRRAANHPLMLLVARIAVDLRGQAADLIDFGRAQIRPYAPARLPHNADERSSWMILVCFAEFSVIAAVGTGGDPRGGRTSICFDRPAIRAAPCSRGLPRMETAIRSRAAREEKIDIFPGGDRDERCRRAGPYRMRLASQSFGLLGSGAAVQDGQGGADDGQRGKHAAHNARVVARSGGAERR